MSYWAENDPLFADGHCVEDWELRRFEALTARAKALVRAEAGLGNKLVRVLDRTVFLARPPSCGVLNLPSGFAFLCPLQHDGVRVYDGDEDGVILSLEGNERIYPSGLESPDDRHTGNAV
jgi:hypothetical protein